VLLLGGRRYGCGGHMHSSAANGVFALACRHHVFSLRMLRMLLNWVLSAVALLIVAHLIPGIYVASFWTALWAAIVIGFVNATLGLVLKVLTFPLTVFTLGIFWLIINAVMLEIASALVRGFHVSSFAAAFFGAIMLSLVNIILRWLVARKHDY
jgi:putative membrane protein